MRTASFPALITAGLLALGCRQEPEIQSPFMFFERPDMRAGIKFSVMEATAKRESIGQWVCKELWAGGRRCHMLIDPGTLIATVDGRGRVVHLKIETPPVMRGQGYDPRTMARVDFAKAEFMRMREAWGVVNSPDVKVPSLGSVDYHWIDNQSRWSAGMWYTPLWNYLSPGWKRDMGDEGRKRFADSLAYLPDSVVAIDEFGFEAFMKQEPADGGKRMASKGPPANPLERLQFDLAMVASAQAEHFEDHATYASSTAPLIFLPGDGVHIEIRDATRQGWTAIGTHDAVPGVTCVIHDGSVPSPPSTPKGVTPAPGQVACDTGA